ncbi:MAG: ComF family protein [Colwellia sp.]|nr:ComF family protein [Colwellia sp.]
MTWKQDIKQLNAYFSQAVRRISCCDLCGANVSQSVLLESVLAQALLCQHCVDDLPYFNQALIAGNLLNWPAVHRALPGIHFDQLFSLAPYRYPLDHWLAQLKYLGRFEVADLLSALLCAQWQGIVRDQVINPVDLVLSVPLHVKKWRTRGYNQAHLIAELFARYFMLPYDNKLLIRNRDNDSQMGKSGRQRRKNLANAFSLRSNIPNDIKHILLIDDVVTTGTTASEISKLLKKSGVKTVTLVTVCLSLPKTN